MASSVLTFSSAPSNLSFILSSAFLISDTGSFFIFHVPSKLFEHKGHSYFIFYLFINYFLSFDILLNSYAIIKNNTGTLAVCIQFPIMVPFGKTIIQFHTRVLILLQSRYFSIFILFLFL